ncbi:hypothetical protein DL767_000807 [Monosporascus sp. MG133]|nr:hypothetical protein DL767_000807 [Monosporascus sp. MG133]
MGRKPNYVILQHFERGAKLQDNSNRYQFRCKSCGEDFPKGRIDSLTNHLTKKCPAISQSERINACLALNGIKGNNAANRALKQQQQRNAALTMATTGPYTSHSFLPAATTPATTSSSSVFQNDIWAPLETLAEVSRQIEASEKHDDHGVSLAHTTQAPTTQSMDIMGEAIAAAAAASAAVTEPSSTAGEATCAGPVSAPIANGANPFELEEQFSLDNQPMAYEIRSEQKTGEDTPPTAPATEQHELSAEERLRELLQSVEANPQSAAASAASVAAAATARLHNSLLDPQLLTGEAIEEHITPAATSPDMMIDYHEPERARTPNPPIANGPHENLNPAIFPWTSMTLIPDGIHGPAAVNDHGQHFIGALSKGGFRMDTNDSLRHRHSRARFDSDRRKEVQEVRRIGACIRCRILRKTCSKGTPCDTCKKVLSPRVWRTGCVRTRLSEYIDIYSAGVQIVMSQRRVNGYRTSHHLSNSGVVVEASHFPETGHKAVFQVLQGYPSNIDTNAAQNVAPGPVVLLDNDKEDVPAKMEIYMRQILPDLIKAEPSPYVRVTLETAVQVIKDTNDELLRRSLELWGMVEMMDRERGWTMLAKSPQDGVEDYWIKDEPGSEPYTNISMQLTAGAERKAGAASKSLLNGIQRNLQDGKIKLGFPMFLTVMLFLNCVEKTTWAFKAWEQENLRPKWPLEKPPSEYTTQGHGLCDLLRLLLNIRHILPRTASTDPESPITAKDEDPVVRKYFQDLNITPAFLQSPGAGTGVTGTGSGSSSTCGCGSSRALTTRPECGSRRSRGPSKGDGGCVAAGSDGSGMVKRKGSLPRRTQMVLFDRQFFVFLFFAAAAAAAAAAVP